MTAARLCKITQDKQSKPNKHGLIPRILHYYKVIPYGNYRPGHWSLISNKKCMSPLLFVEFNPFIFTEMMFLR
jgi:hypothetical protein